MKKFPGSDGFTNKYFQEFSEEITSILLELFETIKRERLA